MRNRHHEAGELPVGAGLAQPAQGQAHRRNIEITQIVTRDFEMRVAQVLTDKECVPG